MLACTEPRSAESYPRPLALSFKGNLEGLLFSPLRPAVFIPNPKPSNAPFASRAGLRDLPTFQRSVSRPLPLREPKSLRMIDFQKSIKTKDFNFFYDDRLTKKQGVGGVMANQLSSGTWRAVRLFGVPSKNF